jgi:glycosyltransferase involved in cell wall biosynthesis
MTLTSIFTETLVIIPALNEEKNIVPIIKGIRDNFPGLDVLVVDDGSADATRQVSIQAGAVVLTLVNNMGYGVALQTGYKYALSKGYQYCIQMDGDGQHNICDIPKLLTPLISGTTDLVIGSRFINGQTGYKIPLARRIGISFFRALVHRFTKNDIRDITSGLQAFNHEALKRYTSDDLPYYYPDADVLILLIKGGFRVTEISTPMNGNAGGKSMHDGIFAQAYYVITMILSIAVIILKGLKN